MGCNLARGEERILVVEWHLNVRILMLQHTTLASISCKTGGLMWPHADQSAAFHPSSTDYYIHKLQVYFLSKTLGLVVVKPGPEILLLTECRALVWAYTIHTACFVFLGLVVVLGEGQAWIRAPPPNGVQGSGMGVYHCKTLTLVGDWVTSAQCSHC